ncbi:hypothetical protein P389DRAFT_196995 [Cystobasidium minutum MCA 4210]|uniref:uncharacterized protein n=1 Tax=Cystobasidium minutum MCA 4210 TaxID=1397322 RepID=UPI0034CDA4E5|eukprot:jgi/Rhomi1/196995/gm1.5209_g
MKAGYLYNVSSIKATSSTYRRNKGNYNVNIAEICGIKKTSKICWHLAKAGMTAAGVSVLLLFNIIATLVAMVARPTFTTIPKNGPLSQYAAGT